MKLLYMYIQFFWHIYIHFLSHAYIAIIMELIISNSKSLAPLNIKCAHILGNKLFISRNTHIAIGSRRRFVDDVKNYHPHETYILLNLWVTNPKGFFR